MAVLEEKRKNLVFTKEPDLSVHHKSSRTRDIAKGVAVKLGLFNVRQTDVQEQHSVVFSLLYNFPSSVL